MNNCIDIRKQLSLYIDNMLTESQMKSIKEHLAVCDACNQEYLELQEIKTLLSNIGNEEVPEEFDKRLRAAFRNECENSEIFSSKIDNKNINNVKKFNYKRLSAVAAVFVIGIFSIAMYNNTQLENEYTDIDFVEPRLSSMLNVDVSDGEINSYSNADDDVTAKEESRGSIDMQEDTIKYSVNKSFDSNNNLNSGEISKNNADDTLQNSDASESKDTVTVYSFDHYLDLIENDLMGTSFSVISQEKDSSGVFCFIIELNSDITSESEKEYRLYKGSEGNILWETINR